LREASVADRLTLNVSNEGPIATVDLQGEIDLATIDMLTDEVFAYLDVDSVEQVFIDLRDVTFIDSSGVGALMRCKNKSVKAGKTLHVVGTHDWVADTLRLGGVSDYLTQPGS
jgi:anti-anti-sigma factor